jgi:hypothetical protein
MSGYPQWFYYPSRTRPPQWVHEFIAVVAEAKAAIDSLAVSGLDRVLASLSRDSPCWTPSGT